MGGNEPRAIGHYSAAEVARLAGVSARRIGSWARYGIIPSISKKPRVYSYADAAEAVLVQYLLQQGLDTTTIRLIVLGLRDRHTRWPLTNAPLEHDGAFLVIREGDEVFFSAAVPDQQVAAGTFVNLLQVRTALEAGGWVAIKTPRKHIEVDPERLSGQPVVRGHRVSTETVADLATRPQGLALLREDYQLTDDEIKEAVEYEADVADALSAA